MDLMLIVFFMSLIIILSGAVYEKLQSNSITEPLVALVVGVIVGPDVLDIIHSASTLQEMKILKIACEFTIAVALMATALRLPQHFFRKNVRTASILVIFGMILMWLLGACVFYLTLPEFSFGLCLLLAAIIAPTDPVVASTLTSGKTGKKYLPPFLRNNLSFEAGVNDGLAYPFVFLGLLLAGFAQFDLAEWTTRILLYENVLCAILAYLVGMAAGFVLKKGNEAGLMNKKTVLPFSLAVALLLLSGFNVLKMNGIIAVFFGSLAFAKDITQNEESQEKNVQESMERLTTTPVFFILGLMLPWQDWIALGWKAFIIPVLILFFRRLPATLSLMPFMPDFKNKTFSAAMLGWFGPMGVATLYYATHIKEKAAMEEVWVIPSLIVVASTLVHGLSSVPLEKLYYKLSSRANELGEKTGE